MTQGISGSGARRWSVRKHCRAGQVSDNSARWLTCLGGRGKADCGTQAERTWSRGPAGSVPRRSFGSFPIAGKGTRPAGRNPFRHPTAGTREGRPLIRHGMRRDTFPPAGGRLWGRLWKPPLRDALRPLRRGALCAPAGRPAGRNPLGAILRLGWGEEDPSSVTAYAVTPSPLWGEGFSGGWKPPLRDAFGLCTPLRHVTGPGMAGRARLLCKGRNQNSGEDLCLPRPGQRLISRFSVRPRR